jgi:hypothetical protein
MRRNKGKLMTENELKINKIDDILAVMAKALRTTEDNIKFLKEHESDDFPALKFMKEQKQKYINQILLFETSRDHLGKNREE